MKKRTKRTEKADPMKTGIPNICFSLCRDAGYLRRLDSKTRRRFREQRQARGFDDTEVWELRTAASEFLLPRLRAYRESAHGTPFCLCERNAKRGEKVWKKILDEIIWMLGENVIDNGSFEIYHKYFDENSDLRPGMSRGDWIKEEERYTRRLERACRYLGKYFLELWD